MTDRIDPDADAHPAPPVIADPRIDPAVLRWAESSALIAEALAGGAEEAR